MIILTLDAGGTNFVFSAIKDRKQWGQKIQKPSNGDNLDLCLQNIIDGFTQLAKESNFEIDAISFAFPGPADFSKGIIGDLQNLPAFRGGVALGPMLEEIFKVPVFINNDGDLYALGEALAGTLPFVNSELKNNNSSKQYKNLSGMTIGTGFGAGLVHDGILIKGDNICAGEIFATSNRVAPEFNSEEGVSKRAVRYFYSEFAEINFEDSPQPKEIFEIAKRSKKGNSVAAIKAYEKIGRYIGDSIANVITLFDCIVVIGGGIAGAKEFIIPGIEMELKREFLKHDGNRVPRINQQVFCLNKKSEFEDFLQEREKKIYIPFSDKSLCYDSVPRCAYMFSNYDTSEMISLGAYFYAMEKIETSKKEIFSQS